METPEHRLHRLLTVWKTMDEKAWTEARVRSLYRDICDIFREHAASGGWYGAWKKGVGPVKA